MNGYVILTLSAAKGKDLNMRYSIVPGDPSPPSRLRMAGGIV